MYSFQSPRVIHRGRDAIHHEEGEHYVGIHGFYQLLRLVLISYQHGRSKQDEEGKEEIDNSHQREVLTFFLIYGLQVLGDSRGG